MSVFREVKIEWEGQEYVFTPNMKLIRLIERGDGTGPVSIVELLHGANSGKPQLSFLAWIVALVMNHAGAEVDEAELYADMHEFNKEAYELYRTVIDAISPSRKEVKKTVAPEE